MTIERQTYVRWLKCPASGMLEIAENQCFIVSLN